MMYLIGTFVGALFTINIMSVVVIILLSLDLMVPALGTTLAIMATSVLSLAHLVTTIRMLWTEKLLEHQLFEENPDETGTFLQGFQVRIQREYQSAFNILRLRRP